MQIWYAIPTCNPSRAHKTLKKWKRQGYKTMALYDDDLKGSLEDTAAVIGADVTVFRNEYEGYYVSASIMAESIHSHTGSYPDIMVCGGDDMDPDPNLDAQTIAEQCYAMFPDGYFVMQPIGDDLQGTEQICGSPWLGKRWIEEAYEGHGPFCNLYSQYFGDEELKIVAQRQSALWQRGDLVQKHHHWLRPGIQKQDYQAMNEQKFWRHDEKIFRDRQLKDFPGSARKGGGKVRYSQGREEEILIARLNRLGLKKGRFLDIGAYTGTKFSNSRYLIEHGWSGTMVEPSPSVFPALQELYADRDDVLTIQAALVATHPPIVPGVPPGHMKFWDASGDATSTSERANMELWKKAGSKFKEVMVPTIGWNSLPGPYDIVSIDTEGTSVDLVKLMPKSYEPSIIIVEHDGRLKIREIVEKRFGLKYVWHDGNNMIWAKES